MLLTLAGPPLQTAFTDIWQNAANWARATKNPHDPVVQDHTLTEQFQHLPSALLFCVDALEHVSNIRPMGQNWSPGRFMWPSHQLWHSPLLCPYLVLVVSSRGQKSSYRSCASVQPPQHLLFTSPGLSVQQTPALIWSSSRPCTFCFPSPTTASPWQQHKVSGVHCDLGEGEGLNFWCKEEWGALETSLYRCNWPSIKVNHNAYAARHEIEFDTPALENVIQISRRTLIYSHTESSGLRPGLWKRSVKDVSHVCTLKVDWKIHQRYHRRKGPSSTEKDFSVSPLQGIYHLKAQSTCAVFSIWFFSQENGTH